MDRAVQWVQRFFHTCLSANVLKFQVDFYFQPNFFQLHNVICSTDIFDMEDVWLPMNSDDINKDTKFLNWLSSPSSKLFYSIKKRSFLHFWLDGVESSSVETVAFSISIFFQFDFLRFVRFRCGHLFGHLSFVTFLLLKYEVSLSIETKWILPPPLSSQTAHSCGSARRQFINRVWKMMEQPWSRHQTKQKRYGPVPFSSDDINVVIAVVEIVLIRSVLYQRNLCRFEENKNIFLFSEGRVAMGRRWASARLFFVCFFFSSFIRPAENWSRRRCGPIRFGSDGR